LLRTIELDELIVNDGDAYVALAIKLAGNTDLRNSLRSRIRARMENAPKFLDAKWYGQQAGAAFEQMWKERAGSGRQGRHDPAPAVAVV
jgi:predicted O-linked N-acetylglucosamine transferase (SPINDLY family)